MSLITLWAWDIKSTRAELCKADEKITSEVEFQKKTFSHKKYCIAFNWSLTKANFPVREVLLEVCNRHYLLNLL